MVFPELSGYGLDLRPFSADQISPRYLGWLSDAEVNRFSKRSNLKPTTAEDARAYIESLRSGECIFGVHVEGHGHVGNLKCGPINPLYKLADISIMIGERSVWGQGVGRRAVRLLSEWLFFEQGLHRLEAGSANPAFITMVKSLGWQVEGVQRRRVPLGGEWIDWTLLGQLASDFPANFSWPSAGPRTAS